MEAALIIFALMLLALVGLGVYATVKVVGAAKRGVERTVTQARRTVEDASLRAKSFGQIGTAGTLAQLRLDLRTSMRATQEALHQGVRTDASLQESLSLFERLSAHGRELDDELKRLEQEPDKGNLAQRLPELRERTQRITQSADSLRWAVHDRARRFSDDELSLLSSEIEVESTALRDWSVQQPPSAAPSAPAPGPAASAPSPSPAPNAPSQTTTPTTPSPTTAPTPPPPTAPDPRRPALDASRPASPYPWTKTTRPETTT
ncbi:hypothetical protein [Streptomyces bambusae]|uniref:Secreted protein n=1 Tax=Streptomyces bambusae TaxID=1550616 RepID=A0ABS6Z0T1_9ACTN|nr:hypothetical protein [Streptomyces bambusae]MBW5481354.1 hypothetical protein [Streptomyces bambusae]